MAVAGSGITQAIADVVAGLKADAMKGAYELTCIRSHERSTHFLWFGLPPPAPPAATAAAHKLHGSAVWVWHMKSCEPTVNVVSQGGQRVGECVHRPAHRTDSDRFASQLRGWCEVDSEVATVRACVSLERDKHASITSCQPWADTVNPTSMHSWYANRPAFVWGSRRDAVVAALCPMAGWSLSSAC